MLVFRGDTEKSRKGTDFHLKGRDKLRDKTTATSHLEWDRRWKTEEGRSDWLEPEPEVMAAARLLREAGASRALDLGCGVGRHSIFLSSLGFSVFAFDASHAGIAFARSQAEAERIHFMIGLMTELPIEDCSLDYLLAWNVIYHGNRAIVRQSLDEIRRVLGPGGFFQGTMLSKSNDREGMGREIEPGTYIVEGAEDDKANPHFYCNAADLTELFAGFDFIDLVDRKHETIGLNHWRFLAKRI